MLAPHMTDALSAYFDSFNEEILPERVLRQVAPLQDSNQPVRNLVPYLSLVHDREVLEVRRGCDRGCRFCQPGYTFLPVRERSAEELVELSKKALANSGHQEYSMLSLCVSDYTSLQESVRSLNREHSYKRTSLSFPSQRADRMFLDVDEEYKAVRRSGITLAPEAGTEKMRKVINKGLSHEQILNAIETAYDSGWDSVKLYFMCGLPFEDDDDLAGIIAILKEATLHCRAIRKKIPVLISAISILPALFQTLCPSHLHHFSGLLK
ncbi:MAG: radical SAM protein [Candidatus Obscuribacter sp.]|nr:radical SAM protein [Candidatus Obscuribacter sp.]